MPQSFLPLGVKPPEHETQLTKVEEFASGTARKKGKLDMSFAFQLGSMYQS